MIKHYLLALVLGLTSCAKNRYHLYSLDKTKCITIISTDLNTRYIISGYTAQLPDTNYIKLNLVNVDKIVNGVDGCWQDNGYEWSLTLRNEAIIEENKLDTDRYKIYQFHDRNKNLKPVPKAFGKREKDCFGLHFNYARYESHYGDIILE